MKAALYKDGVGLIVGRLKTPTQIQYEDDGHVKMLDLTGNVLETEYNDVLVFGKEDGVCFVVEKMESLPKKDDGMVAFVTNGDTGPVYCLAIPEENVTDIEERYSESSGSIYHILHANLNKNTTLYLNILGSFSKETRNKCYVFLLNGALSKQNKEFGIGYAKKEWTVRSGSGWQVMS